MAFRYLKDPLFLLCLVLYFVNRWVLKPWFPNEFSLCYFNDLICLPFWIPIMLFLLRKARLRSVDLPPRTVELIIPLLLWSWVFELLLPKLEFFRRLTTSDYRDVLFYTVGASLAAIVWRLYYGEPRQSMQPGTANQSVQTTGFRRRSLIRCLEHEPDTEERERGLRASV